MRIAFDLDETLGIPIIESNSIIGFRIREGCVELLEKLKRKHSLILWTVSSRNYLEKVLSFDLAPYFVETYSWDEIQCTWKDIRKIQVDCLIDDSEHHRSAAKKHSIESRYIVVAAFGGREDMSDPLLWIKQIEGVLGE